MSRVYTTPIPVRVVTDGGILVRQVDSDGVVIDDDTTIIKTATPVIEVNEDGSVPGDATRVYDTYLKVRLTTEAARTVISVGVDGIPVDTPLGGGGVLEGFGLLVFNNVPVVFQTRSITVPVGD